MRKSLVDRGVLSFAIATLLLAVVGWIAYSRVVALTRAADLVNHTLLVHREAERVLSLAKDAETGQRGFVITGSPEFLQPLQTAIVALPRHLDTVRHLTADNPVQQVRLAKFDSLLSIKLHELRTTIAVRDRDGLAAAARLVREGEGARVMDEMRAVMSNVVREGDRLLAERQEQERRDSTQALVMTLGSLVIAVLLLVLATVLLGRGVAQRERAHRAQLAELSARELRFSKAFHASPVASCLTTVDQGRFLDVNQRFLDTTKYTRDEIVGHRPHVFDFPEGNGEGKGIVSRLSKGESLREVSITYRDRHGTRKQGVASIELLDIDGQQCLLTLLWRA